MTESLKFKVAADADLTELKKLSTVNLIIFVLGLSEIKHIKLTPEDVAIECWLVNPEKHSLRGYPQFPDSNIVIKRLADMKGRNGLVEGTSRSGYKLTQLSKKRFNDMSRDVTTKATRAVRSRNADDRSVSSIDEAPYKRLTRTPAYKKFINGEIEKIVESDFLYFYGISWNSNRAYTEGRIRNVDLVIASFSEKDLILKKLSDFLNEKFKHVKESI